MSSSSDTNSPNLGILNIESVLPVSSAPPIIFAWAGLIPLVIYLSTYRHSYKLVGKTALGCSLGVTIFPRLGILRSIADLLDNGPEYLDRACSLGELRKEVWNTNYGFPCANGAATEMITSSVMKRAPGIICMPDNFSAPKPPGISPQNGAANFETEPQSQFRRY
jgi:hypothetical protein